MQNSTEWKRTEQYRPEENSTKQYRITNALESTFEEEHRLVKGIKIIIVIPTKGPPLQ